MKFLENLEFSVTALFTQDSEEPVLDDDGKPLYKADGSPKTKKVKAKSLQIAFRDAAKDKDIALAVVKCDDVEEDVAKEMIGKVFEKFPLWLDTSKKELYDAATEAAQTVVDKAKTKGTK